MPNESAQALNDVQNAYVKQSDAHATARALLMHEPRLLKKQGHFIIAVGENVVASSRYGWLPALIDLRLNMLSRFLKSENLEMDIKTVDGTQTYAFKRVQLESLSDPVYVTEWMSFQEMETWWMATRPRVSRSAVVSAF